MSDKKSVTVNIYGNEYNLKGDADPAYIAELSKYVDGKMNEVGRKSSATATKVAILAAMNIADEYHRAEKSRVEAQKLLEVAERNLLDMRRSSEGSIKHTLELKQAISKNSDDVSEARKGWEEARQEADLLRDKAEKAEKLVVATHSEVEKLKQELQNAKAETQSLREKGKSTQTEVEDAKKKSERSHAELQEALQAVEKGKNELMVARTEINALREKSKKALADLEEARKGSSSSEDLKRQLQEALQKAEQGRVETAKVRQDLEAALVARDKALAEAKAKPTVSDDDLNVLIAESQKDIEAARKDASEKIRVKDEELNRVRKAAQEAHAAAEERFKILSDELEATRKNAEAASSERETLKRQMADRSEAAPQLDQVTKTYQTQLEASLSEIKSLKTRVLEMENAANAAPRSTTADKNADAARQEAEELRGRLRDALDQLQKARAEVKALSEKAASGPEPQISFLPPPNNIEKLIGRIDAVLEVR